MSTILDALRKVERERDSSPDLETQQVTPEVRRRRRFPVVPILVCALVGFGGGAILSWLMPARQEVEVGALPVPLPPPAIPVPREPVRVRPAAPPAPVADAKRETADEVTAAAAAPIVPPPAAIAPPAAVAGAPKPVSPVGVEAPQQPAGATHPVEAVAGLDKQDSVLEPSPFAPPREPERGVVAPATNPAPKVAAVPNVAVPSGPAHETEVAGLEPAPPPASEPTLEEAGQPSEPEPERDTPAETIIDTGRSPPNNPKVTLSFLQWSADPARRFAFISVDGAPSQRIREGEVAGGLTVAAITKTGVQFKRDNTSFMIRPRH